MNASRLSTEIRYSRPTIRAVRSPDWMILRTKARLVFNRFATSLTVRSSFVFIIYLLGISIWYNIRILLNWKGHIFVELRRIHCAFYNIGMELLASFNSLLKLSSAKYNRISVKFSVLYYCSLKEVKMNWKKLKWTERN